MQLLMLVLFYLQFFLQVLALDKFNNPLYWLDESCTKSPRREKFIRDAMTEAIQMAITASYTLESVDWFHLLFNVKEPEGFADLRTHVRSLANLKGTKCRAESDKKPGEVFLGNSDIRLYCDEDEHWSKVPPEKEKKYRPKGKGWSTFWRDTPNAILIKNQPTCQIENDKHFSGLYGIGQPGNVMIEKKDEVNRVMRITMCNIGMYKTVAGKSSYRTPTFAQLLKERGEIYTKSTAMAQPISMKSDEIGELPSLRLLYQMIQFPFKKEISPPINQAPDQSLGTQWDEITALEDSSKSYKDAWTIAYFGLLGIMRKNGWGVMTERPSWFKEGKLWHESLDWGQQKFQGEATNVQ